MVFYITVLRALASCLITNAHYTGIYPNDIIANGGLIGDILFFAVSGYCLYYIKNPFSMRGFFRWYGKRLYRVYPPVLVATFVYLLLGYYVIAPNIQSVIWWFIYPTYYHFVASIIVLYIPYFFIIKIARLRDNLPMLMLIIAVIYLLIYLTFYDKSYYHIDTVREPMIRFLFMESMLLGAWFRQNEGKLRNNIKLSHGLLTGVAFIIYFASKLLFARKESLSAYQILNQAAIFVLLLLLLRTFCGMDGKLENLPQWAKKIISFIAGMSLEIYAVQYVLIDVVREQHLHFPINWFLITAAIFISAFILHMLCEIMYKSVNKAMTKVKMTKSEN